MADGKSAVIVARDPPGVGGTLQASLPGGESCSGNFSNVGVRDAGALCAFDVPLTEHSEASLAVLTCNRGRVLRCALASRYDGGFSYGACKDAQGQEYSVVF
jgi:hypothetical protein